MAFFPTTPKGLVDVYPSKDLPEGFRYPQRFLDMVGVTDTRWYYPWYFTPIDSEAGKFDYNFFLNDKAGVFKGYPPLVPFSSLESNDGDTACFDGSDTSGDPPVIVPVLDKNGLNYGRRDYGYRNFDHWLEEAEKEAQNWDRLWIEDPDFKGYDIKYN